MFIRDLLSVGMDINGDCSLNRDILLSSQRYQVRRWLSSNQWLNEECDSKSIGMIKNRLVIQSSDSQMFSVYTKTLNDMCSV